MSSAGRGYGEGFFYTPEDQAAQEGIRRRQAYAQALMQGQHHQGQYGGLADAGNSIAGALLAKRADKDATGLATQTQTKYAADLANLLKGGSGPSPQISNSAGSPQELDPEGNPMAAQGPQLDPEGNPMASQAPGQGQSQSIMERIAASGNPALMYQFGPQALQAQMQNEMTRGNKLWENDLPESRAAREGRAGALQNQEDAAKFNNQLPMNAAQSAADQRSRDTNALGYAQLNKPVQLSYGSSLVDPKTGQPIGGGQAGGGAAPSSPFGTGDENSPSLNGQLGISSNGLNLLMGNTSAVARGRPMDIASKEIDQVIARRGLDPSVVKPKVQAYGDAVKMNTLKSNTMDTLANEIKGTVDNLAPVADQLGGGNLRWVKGAAQFAGGLANSPVAQQYAIYLGQLRADLAGFNATSGGKIGLHGQVQTDNADFEHAEKVIKDGLDRGGAKGLAEAIEATRIKNVAVVEKQSQEATKGIWNALGLGKQYDKLHPAQSTAAPPLIPGGNVTPEAARAELARRRAAQGK